MGCPVLRVGQKKTSSVCHNLKTSKIDHICAVAFLAEYISRQRKANETPETPNPENTRTTMNANEIISSLNEKQVRNAAEVMEAAGMSESVNETMSAAIIAELNTRKDRSAWDKGVTAYATELAESLGNWEKQPESIAELKEMMLNGASDWNAYSWGGSSLIYNQEIAERLCSPSELKRVTNKNGLRDYPNSRENWLDVQARALNQASRRVVSIAAKYLSK